VLHQAPDYTHQFFGSLGLNFGLAADHAVVSVIFQEPQRNLVESCLYRGDLGHDIDAVPIVLNHPLNTANLAFDSP
jgi:hypothetical protein